MIFKNLFPLRLLILVTGWIPSVHAMDLIDVYDLAFANDPVFLEARFTKESAQQFRPQAIANFLPVISASGDTKLTRLHNKKTDTFQSIGVGKTQNFWTNTIAVKLEQSVFNNKFWVALDQSENKIAQAEAEYAAAEQELIVRTTEHYLDVLLAEDTLDFSRSEKLALARQLEQAQQRFKVGLIAITDVFEAQAGYDKATADEIDAANELDNRKEELREIIGNQPIDLSGLGEDLPLLKPAPENIEDWSDLASRLNLTIIAKQNETEDKRKQIDLERSGHYPTLKIVGSYRYQDENSSFGLRGDTGSIGVELEVPLFQGGAIYSKTTQAELDYKAAQQSLAAERRSIIRQVKEGYRGVISTISQVKARSAAIKSSESALEATVAGFEVGTRTMVDVVDEQRNLFETKRDHAKTRYDYIKNWLQLKQAASDLNRQDLEKFNRLLVAKIPPT